MRRTSAALAALVATCALACTDGDVDPSRITFDLDEHWPSRSTYPGVGAGRVILTNNLDDTLSIFDLATIGDPAQQELARVPLGLVPVELEGPHHAAVDPSGAYYYVAISNYVPGGGSGPHGAHGTGRADGYCLKYRAPDNELVASVRVDPNPGDITISPDGKTIYLTHYDLLRIQDNLASADPTAVDARLAIVDAETMTRKVMVSLCPAPHGVLTSADGRWVYAACYSDELAIVDTTDPSYPVTRVKVAADAGGVTDAVYGPYALAVDPVRGDVWVSGTRAKRMLVWDAATGEMRPDRAVDLEGGPIFGGFSADGARLYVAHQGTDGVAVIDPATSTVLRTVRLPPPVCTSPHQIVLDPSETWGLLSCEGDHVGPGTFVVLELAPEARYHHHVPVGVFPDYVGVIRGPR
ncbi:YncE family protein [Myxococcota bacterium]|nr:YncE family protein [Myxococcota bacterium]